MKLPLTSVQKSKIGTCPHGLPAGACPICSGMSGGGGGAKKSDRVPGEMSWDECFAVGQMLKAQKLAQQQRNQAMQANLYAPLPTKMEQFAQKMAVIAEKLANFIQKPEQSNLPKIIAKPLALVAKMALPILNIIKNVPIVIQNLINFVKEKFVDISDKLNAVFGELKNSVEKKISERFKDMKKKMKSLFGLFEPIEDEISEVEDIKRENKFFSLFTSHLSLKKKELEDADS